MFLSAALTRVRRLRSVESVSSLAASVALSCSVRLTPNEASAARQGGNQSGRLDTESLTDGRACLEPQLLPELFRHDSRIFLFYDCNRPTRPCSVAGDRHRKASSGLRPVMLRWRDAHSWQQTGVPTTGHDEDQNTVFRIDSQRQRAEQQKKQEKQRLEHAAWPILRGGAAVVAGSAAEAGQLRRNRQENGGASRNRTGVYGVAVRCITTLPSRPGSS